MRSIGGLRPTEINPDAANTLNADIVFRDANVILEVKTLMTDPTERADHIERVSAIYNRWAGRPGVPIIYGKRAINSADVPREMGFELARTLADPIRTAVTKANRQIRQVKASLGMPEAHGILLLCNAGATTQTPHVILHALHHALGKRHSSINSAIFMTHGVPANVPGVPEPVEVFASVTRPGHDPLSAAFGEKIRDAWLRFQARKRPIRFYPSPDGNIWLNASNARRREV